jgi:hypothetical protein
VAVAVGTGPPAPSTEDEATAAAASRGGAHWQGARVAHVASAQVGAPDDHPPPGEPRRLCPGPCHCQ